MLNQKSYIYLLQSIRFFRFLSTFCFLFGQGAIRSPLGRFAWHFIFFRGALGGAVFVYVVVRFVGIQQREEAPHFQRWQCRRKDVCDILLGKKSIVRRYERTLEE